MTKSPIATLAALLFTGVVAVAPAAMAEKQAILSPQNPYLAHSYNNQTHWNDAASDSTNFAVPRGSYDVTPDSFSIIPNEGMGLPHFTDFVDGVEIHWYWAGHSLRKVKVENSRLVEIDRLDMRVALPNYQPVTAEQRLEQAAAVQKFLDAKDEHGLLAYMKAQPNRMLSATTDQAIDGSIYSLLTKDDAFVGANARKVFRIEQIDPKNPAARMQLAREVTLPPAIFDNEKVKASTRLGGDSLFGMGMSFNGYLVVNTLGGKVVTMDRKSLDVIDIFSVDGKDEVFLNSFATGEEAGGGAIYVASNQHMYRLVVDKDGKIRSDEASGAWKAAYERGRRFGSVKIADGTGSTPTLMGFGPGEDKLVVITDGAERMHLVAMWRDQIPGDWKAKPGMPSSRIVDMREVNPDQELGTVQSEQSVSVFDKYAFVVNNIPAKEDPFLAHDGYYVNILNGATRPPARGVAMLKWSSTEHAWTTLWTRKDVGSVSVVPMISGGSRMAIFDGYFADRLNERYQVGLDLDTGKTALKIRTGSNPIFNGMYAPVKCDSQGRLLYGMAFGLVLMDTSRMKQAD